ncbi:AraC family transcriptional regulator [Lacticaseibacillus kribbianus]|uniref:AraC family transcriptional regulator n=1 Tax=Lacticaseibacillus kribbianus TaxID=2926292 RepID=UPI001CD60FE6|nr:AraC family transcriptional regulator [Lacticaseibacillus kribbianus]
MEHATLTTLAQEEMLDLRLYQAGRSDCEPLHYYGPVKRNHYLFHLVTAGCGTLQSTRTTGETVTYHLSAGSGFLIVPGQVNTYYADRQDPWSYAWVEFDGLQAYRLLQLAELGQDRPIFRTPDAALVTQLQAELVFLADHPTASPLALLAHTYLAVDLLTRRRGQPPRDFARSSQRQQDYALRAIEFIAGHYAEPIGVADVASWCNLSRSYLGAIFQKLYGKGVQDFLIGYRMSKACELLTLGDAPIRAVAGQVGYPNQLAFSRAFARRFGMPPTEWRRQKRPDAKNLRPGA